MWNNYNWPYVAMYNIQFDCTTNVYIFAALVQTDEPLCLLSTPQQVDDRVVSEIK